MYELPVFRVENARHWAKIEPMSALRNLGQWVLSVFLSPLGVDLNPKIAEVFNFTSNSRARLDVLLNLNSLNERDMGGAHV